MCYEIGKKECVLGKEIQNLTSIPDIYGKPTFFPLVGQNEDVICGYDQGLGERLFVCQSLNDMQKLYDYYETGMALCIYWYRGTISKFQIFEIRPSAKIVVAIVNKTEIPQEVKDVIASYAMGNPGVALVLSEHSKDFQTATQVEELVGWPLSEHSFKRTEEIWERFKD